MIRRRKVRELAMQMLFLWDAHSADDLEMARQVCRDSGEESATCEQAVAAAKSAWEQRAATDRWVERVAPQWPVHRQPPVDRAILRFSTWELTSTTTPARVVIDEAIELAKHFSTQNSASFINGVLDAIYKEHKTLTATAQQGPVAGTEAAPAPSPDAAEGNGV
jgi:N utilization substance protein B